MTICRYSSDKLFGGDIHAWRPNSYKFMANLHGAVIF